MIEVLYGVEVSLIEKYINEYIKKNKIDNVIKYDYMTDDINVIMNELSYSDLFGNNKLVILYNSEFLTSKSSTDITDFEKYIYHPNESNKLIMVTYNEKLDERKKTVKSIKNEYKITEFNSFSLYDAEKYVKEKLSNDGYKYEYNAIKKIVEYLSTNSGLYDNEIQKLELYKYDERYVTVDDVINVVSKMPEDNIFKLVDAVIKNDKEEIFRIYKDIVSLGTDEISILGLISSQFRFLYQVSVLTHDGKTKNEIISILGSHPYKTEITIRKVNEFKESHIADILYKLALIDIKIKTGEYEKSRILEQFFIEI